MPSSSETSALSSANRAPKFLFPASAPKLRKVDPRHIHDTSSPLIKSVLDMEGDERNVAKYQQSVLDVNIESWYDLITEHTFATEFLPFSAEVGQLFVDAYLDYESYLKAVVVAGGTATVVSGTVTSTSTATAEGATTGIMAATAADVAGTVATPSSAGYTPPRALQQRMDALATTLQPVIDRVRGTTSTTTPVFVKASSRSAKDAPTSQQKLANIYRERLAASEDGSAAVGRSDNTKLRCMLEAGLEVMKAFTAHDTLALFMRSERIYQDMLLALEASSAHALGWNENFAVRAWVDMDVDMEFRGFVKGGRLTALSQYNHLIYSERLVEQRVEIERDIRAFFADKLAHRLAPHHTDYVIDFALTPAPAAADGAALATRTTKIWVIELNPFLETTDGCLFSWKRDRDAIDGVAKGPPEMRVCHAPRNGAKALIASDWRKLYDCEGVGFDTADTYRG